MREDGRSNSCLAELVVSLLEGLPADGRCSVDGAYGTVSVFFYEFSCLPDPYPGPNYGKLGVYMFFITSKSSVEESLRLPLLGYFL